MLKSLRWRLTIWFVVLTTIVIAMSAIFGVMFFTINLNDALDDELKALASEIAPSIDVSGPAPSLRQWAELSRRVPFKLVPTIQLFDIEGNLVDHHGPVGVSTLYPPTQHEVESKNYSFRVYSTPLKSPHGKIEGYLQLQITTRGRDRAIEQFLVTIALGTPLMIFGMGVAGYLYSSKAARPLEESIVILRTFMADAGHELSTPISIIQTNAEQMEQETKEPEKIESRLAVISRSTERLGALVKDLMLLSRMESPQLAQTRVNVDLEKLVIGILEEVDELFKSKKVNLVRGKMEPCTVFGDPEALKRLVTNLLQNAVRYTEEAGTVTVTLGTHGRFARIAVADTGIGIPSESLPRIFDRFYRVDKSRSRAAGGSGLGLSIAKAIVDAHKGKFEVQSTVGAGSTFIVMLPSKTLTATVPALKQ